MQSTSCKMLGWMKHKLELRLLGEISGGENLLNFLKLWQVLSIYEGNLMDPRWWPHERPVPMGVARGLSAFLSPRCRGLRSCVESVPEPEDSSPVLTWILGYFWSLPGVSVLVSSGGMHVRSRAVAGVSRFPSCGSRDQGLYLEAFP